MPPRLRQAMGAGGYYVITMSRCPDVWPVPTSAFLSLRTNAERISMKSGKVITTINRWTDYISGEIVRGTRQQDTTENSNERQTGAATYRMTSQIS